MCKHVCARECMRVWVRIRIHVYTRMGLERIRKSKFSEFQENIVACWLLVQRVSRWGKLRLAKIPHNWKKTIFLTSSVRGIIVRPIVDDEFISACVVTLQHTRTKVNSLREVRNYHYDVRISLLKGWIFRNWMSAYWARMLWRRTVYFVFTRIQTDPRLLKIFTDSQFAGPIWFERSRHARFHFLCFHHFPRNPNR